MKTITDVRIALGLDEIVRYENFESFFQDYNKHFNQNLRWKKNLSLRGWLSVTPSELLAVLGEPVRKASVHRFKEQSGFRVQGLNRMEYIFQINRNFINLYSQHERYDDREFRNSTKPQLFNVLGHDDTAVNLIRNHLVNLGINCGEGEVYSLSL